MAATGKVYLVGAGPGDAGLITVRGLECLRLAGVVVYDNLVNESLLSHARADAEVIFAGKLPGRHTLSQEAINDLLVEKAREGRVVVRLKGGDPFVFGRGGEEGIHLARERVPFEVVPGVTSALAVPAYAGIPATQRFVSSSIHIVTGHEDPESEDASVDWASLAKLEGTLVVLMGVTQLTRIAADLIANGKNADTPAAVVRWGTVPEQEVVTAPLSGIAEAARREGMGPPAVLIVGEVVELRPLLKWVEKKPLFGIRIAVTRPRGQNESLALALAAAGADVVTVPTIKVVARERSATIEREINAVASYDWVVLSSANGVDAFMRLLFDLGYDSRILAGCQVGAVGEKTAEALLRWGVRANRVPRASSQEELARVLRVQRGERVLVPCGSSSRDVLRETLEKREAKVRILPIYDTVPDRAGVALLKRQLTQARLHAVTFTSASTFEALGAAMNREDLQRLFIDVNIASIGPVTTQVIESAGLKVAIQPNQQTAEALAAAIVAHSRKTRRTRSGDTSHPSMKVAPRN